MNDPSRKKYTVAVVTYRPAGESIRETVSLSRGFDGLTGDATVFIKPNIVFWARGAPFPKWGVITTSRVVAEMVRLLKEKGVNRILIGEGTVLQDPKDRETIRHAYASLGYELLKKRYGIRLVDVFSRPFKRISAGDGVIFNMNVDILESDFVVNLPVMKTHAQAVVSLGIKNLKGLIDIPSRKKCHSADPKIDLHRRIASLPEEMPPMFTLIDGIFTNERGPGPDGKIRRSNLLVGSTDVLSADFVAAKILGYRPEDVPHLLHAAVRQHRPADLSDIDIVGETIDAVITPHAYDFAYTQDENGNFLPVTMARQGIRGLSYRKYDTTLCTYCSAMSGMLLHAIRKAAGDAPFDDIEILTGKTMEPTPGKKKTLLFGKCMYLKNRKHPAIRELFAVKSCPPHPEEIASVLTRAGIPAAPEQFTEPGRYLNLFAARYQGKPEFEESFFTVS